MRRDILRARITIGVLRAAAASTTTTELHPIGYEPRRLCEPTTASSLLNAAAEESGSAVPVQRKSG